MSRARAIAAFALFRLPKRDAEYSFRSSRQHAALIKRAFHDVSPEVQRQMEEVLERIARRA